MAYRRILERHKCFKFTVRCRITRVGEPDIVIRRGDRIYIKGGEIYHISRDEVEPNIPAPRECPAGGCTRTTRRRRMCPDCGDVSDVDEDL